MDSDDSLRRPRRVRVRSMRPGERLALLQTSFEEKLAALRDLELENTTLKRRENVLLQEVTQQSGNLHYVAIAAAGGVNEATMVEQLVQDLKVHEMLQMLGTSSTPDEPSTTRWLRAVTPDALQRMREATVDEVAADLRDLTMRLCMLLSAKPGKARLLCETLEDVLNEYGSYGMSLHVAADRVNLQIGMMNLATMEVQEPPPGFWQDVVDAVDLRPDQVGTLCVGYAHFEQTSRPVIASLNKVKQRIHELLVTGGQGGGAARQQPLLSLAAAIGSGSSGDSSMADASDGASAGGDSGGSSMAAGSSHTNVRRSGSISSSGASAAGPLGSEGAPEVASSLSVEAVEELDGLLSSLMQHVMKLRELHRTVTFLWLNTLDMRQNAVSVVESFPWWSRPLTMCQILSEAQAQAQKKRQEQ